MPLFGGLFTKDIKQTSNTTNVDNTRVNTLTDSLNTWISQTQATSNVYNTAFDAVDSFNTVTSYNLANIGGGPAEIPTLDFTGLRDLFASPAELAQLLNANRIDADPNANKYDWSFNDTSAGGNEFLKNVQGLVQKQWEGMAGAKSSPEESKGLSFWLTIILAGGVIALLIFKLVKR